MLLQMGEHVFQAVDENLVDAGFQHPAQFVVDHRFGERADAGDEFRQAGYVLAFGQAVLAVFLVDDVGRARAGACPRE